MRHVPSTALCRGASLCAAVALAACFSGGSPSSPSRTRAGGKVEPQSSGPGKKAPVPPVPAEPAPPETPRLGNADEAATLGSRVTSYFQGHAGRRFYIQLDKPLYKPGETIWVKVWDLTTRTFSGDHPQVGLTIELRNPKGAAVATRRVQEQHGAGQADFDLAGGIEGGEYTLHVQSFDGQSGERPLIVSTYEAPRLKMKLEFVRKAYGAGDEVSATIAVRRPTGEPLTNHPLSALVRLDGQDLPRVELTTNATGEGLIKFRLPQEIAIGDGLLTVLADDGGLTESIAKRVPILVKKLAFSLLPEGGQLVEGLSGRVYFEAKTPLGKPADVSGRIVDDHDATVARFDSVRDGLGRVEFTPSTGRSYHAEIDKPAGISERYPLPLAAPSGCVLRSFDDLDGELAPLRVAVRCSEPRKVIVAAVLRENFLDAAVVKTPKDAPAVVYLRPRSSAGDAESLARVQGVARVTIFDEKWNPLAERLIYRNRRAGLDIRVEPEKPSYSPRDQVTLRVTTRDFKGQPLPAELALSVVDDTVLSFADDKTGHLLSRLYLEPELADKVEEPNFYFPVRLSSWRRYSTAQPLDRHPFVIPG